MIGSVKLVQGNRWISRKDSRYFSHGPRDAKGMPGYAVRLEKEHRDPITGKMLFSGCLQPLSPQTTVAEIEKKHPLPSAYKALSDELTIGELRKATGAVGINNIAETLKKHPEIVEQLRQKRQHHSKQHVIDIIA